MVATIASDEPVVGELTDNDDSHMSVSNQSTKSSQGRKLRQVLQKKQLDVLLQTYSSFIDEAEDTTPPAANDFSLIARKHSIEGNPNAIQMAEIAEHRRNNVASIDEESSEQRAPIGDISRQLMRRNKSLMEEEDESYTEGPEDRQQQEPTHMDDNSDDAVVESKKANKKESSSHPTKEAKETKASKDAARKNKKKKSVSKRKTRVDFTTRMQKANEAMKAFSGRAVEKQLELGAEFLEATKEIRYHLKSGANVVFEDLGDRFDGIVENLFVGESEARDDSGGDPRTSSQSASKPILRSIGGVLQIHHSGFDRDAPTYQPRSHEETMHVMSKQVHDMFEPVAVLADKAQVGCAGVAEDLSLPTGRGGVRPASSF